ncbi:hypothetical protein PIB30_048517 [Stylosanthes scabra]|uniref:Uncharacterized protein n=1 Tax=Stylosanthes scabra TaxID=79078 RepID=A0ABU6XES4_9FABA|nr:hypothetical protein [Stylosanthes scabra]
MGMNGVKSVIAICTPLLARVPPSSFNLKLLTEDSPPSCTAGEFTQVMQIYSNPSWDQYLIVGMARIRRGLTFHSTLGGVFLLGDSSFNLGHSSDHRDAQYFNPWMEHSFTITIFYCF